MITSSLERQDVDVSRQPYHVEIKPFARFQTQRVILKLMKEELIDENVGADNIFETIVIWRRGK